MHLSFAERNSFASQKRNLRHCDSGDTPINQIPHGLLQWFRLPALPISTNSFCLHACWKTQHYTRWIPRQLQIPSLGAPINCRSTSQGGALQDL